MRPPRVPLKKWGSKIKNYSRMVFDLSVSEGLEFSILRVVFTSDPWDITKVGQSRGSNVSNFPNMIFLGAEFNF